MKTLTRSFLTLAASLLLTAAHASSPYTLLVPAPPGGGADTLSRLLAKAAQPHLDGPIVIVNVPGAGGAIGVTRLVRSKPDGHTLAAVWTGPMTVTPHTSQVMYGPQEYTPLLRISAGPYIMCTRSDFPANDGKSFLAELKRNPNKYTFATDGKGGLGQISSMRIFEKNGITQRDVPYKGASESLAALLGQQIDIYTGSVPIVLPYIKEGKMKCLIGSSAKRNALLPKMASLGDLGIPEEESVLWRGLIVPNGTPAESMDILTKAFSAAAKSPDVLKFLHDAGEDLDLMETAAFRKYIDNEYASMGKAIRGLGLSVH